MTTPEHAPPTGLWPMRINHIGILVPDLEEAVERWENALGYHFSRVGRYRTSHYVDRNDPEPHLHDARLVTSKEGPPRIELLEFTGSGTHSASQAGVHHVGFERPVDTEAKLREFAALGIGDDGRSYMDDGRMHVWFTEKSFLDGMRLEFGANFTGPTVAEDGTPLWVDPATNRSSLWGPPEDQQTDTKEQA
jgi:catechol 2,3-dioxygenase-like lactoylglutathione lyase family enzyme